VPSKKRSTSSSEKNISITGDVKDSVVIAGDNNTVHQTIIQKFFNIFKSDSETLEHRNRRILLGHVENAWIKGVLDASLHSLALLDLGIKEEPNAVKTYPWAIKKESTDETLPAGTSMLEIFDSIGMGRSLLILGAPGSGKTTMLLELARQLIARAREDITYPIPMVFNLASWTEKLSLADWLAQELNNLYSVPRKTAPDWVKGNKLLLLLDGLDEVRQESRAKCVEAINAFRKEHGLTSLAVCSRSQDYADLNAKLSFEGAIEVQPLTQKQITEFFNRFGKEMVGIKQVLKKDSALREMAETPLFLSIMIMAYQDKQDVDILVSQDEKAQRKHLFDTYIERMFERLGRSKIERSKKQDVLRWLPWLAEKMIVNNQVPYLITNLQAEWAGQKKEEFYRIFVGLVILSIFVLFNGLIFGIIIGPTIGLMNGLRVGFGFGLLGGGILIQREDIKMVDALTWDWKKVRSNLIFNVIMILVSDLIVDVFLGLRYGLIGLFNKLSGMLLLFWLVTAIISGLLNGLKAKPFSQILYPRQRIDLSIRNFLSVFFMYGLIVGVILGLFFGFTSGLPIGLFAGLLGGLSCGLVIGFFFGGRAIVQHYTLRYILALNNLLPWRLVPFLDHCVDLIFLRRVGGGYIFVHRLLMEHFAEMYVETPTSKGN
jgi:hypothetical protein